MCRRVGYRWALQTPARTNDQLLENTIAHLPKQHRESNFYGNHTQSAGTRMEWAESRYTIQNGGVQSNATFDIQTQRQVYATSDFTQHPLRRLVKADRRQSEHSILRMFLCGKGSEYNHNGSQRPLRHNSHSPPPLQVEFSVQLSDLPISNTHRRSHKLHQHCRSHAERRERQLHLEKRLGRCRRGAWRRLWASNLHGTFRPRSHLQRASLEKPHRLANDSVQKTQRCHGRPR
ncbi:hypothetical protein BDV98DRAFT_309432 [Pterulicium gracile]|uniref:Uncharacterized protein n=1 Tax=Pterulicium gracile TaxID=1884261 RepID=A0A5C3Q2Z6_9AGAR|nr:hypothetical protein BDV98DRAFT_309432 [Pterula gracilis]